MIVNDFDGLARRFRKLADQGMKRVLTNIAEALGETLLNHIIDEIDRQGLIDTGLMWNSFTRGADGNVWEWDVDRNSITLEVGSDLGSGSNDQGAWGYPRLINDGYTIHKAHWVPGYWNSGGSFVYDRNAKTGFMAKSRSFIGRKYFDIAVTQFEGGMNQLIIRRLEIELERVLR
ncbi:HK97 gp10 family phage protein [Paenibacillus sp. MYb67]|uniref:HK97 gp10 family phage protein n=1 Tax=Paenibacillus sp. MYb67 TaxID=2033725 RepID=UPI000CFAFFF0|nr:HK97 gp10 family phage protein [Paenibacillus sp. MYb67]PRA04832.1 terminase [Paenibacillus sp. MYb63]PRA47823.1 terminase [Paenibacillus sp. MYb67]